VKIELSRRQIAVILHALQIASEDGSIYDDTDPESPAEVAAIEETLRKVRERIDRAKDGSR
jgi:hypothetical protein